MAVTEVITDAASANERCADLFSADPLGCNMVASAMLFGRDVNLIRAHGDGRTSGAAIEWSPGFTLTRLRPGAADVLADALPASERLRLMGEAGDAATVAGRWTERTGGSAEAEEMFRVYRLGTLAAPSVPGQMEVADVDHIELATEWGVGFGTETGLGADAAESNAQMMRAVASGRLRAWRADGEIVAQLLVSTPAFGVVRIGGVYTPPAHRGQGFGAALTAAVSASEQARPEVHEMMLNTQASNAMTNRLYRRIGFESVFEVLILWLNP